MKFKNRKFKAIMGVSLAVMLAVPVSVFGISGAFGSSPKAQQSQTTVSPLGLNPETDPVIMTTDYGLEIKLGGALTNSSLSGYAYFTTTGTAGSVNWVIIGYNGVTSGTFPDGVTTENLPPIISADKNTKIDDPSYTKESVETQSGALSSSPLYDPNDPIMSELLATDPVTWYKINYTKTVAGTKTLSTFPNAVGANASGTNQQKAVAKDLDAGEVLCISENILFTEYFGSGKGMYSSDCKLYDAMNAIANSTSYTIGYKDEDYGAPTVCDYGLKNLGLYGEDENGKIMPKTLHTNYLYMDEANFTFENRSNELKNQYVFPLAQTQYAGTSDTPQNFIVENYLSGPNRKAFNNWGTTASNWWLRSGGNEMPNHACCVCNDGGLSSANVGYTYGVRPAFVLKV